MNKPARLNKKDPITVQLTPITVIAGVITLIVITCLAFGSIENINYLMGGV